MPEIFNNSHTNSSEIIWKNQGLLEKVRLKSAKTRGEKRLAKTAIWEDSAGELPAKPA